MPQNFSNQLLIGQNPPQNPFGSNYASTLKNLGGGMMTNAYPNRIQPSPSKVALTSIETPKSNAIKNKISAPSSKSAVGNVIIPSATTPSGATVNTQTGSLITPPPVKGLIAPPTPQDQIQTSVTGLQNLGQNSTPQYTGVQNQAVQATQQDSPDVQTARKALQDSQMAEAEALSQNSQNPIPLEFQQGRDRVLKDQYLQQQTALSNTLNSNVTAQGQRLGLLSNTLGNATTQQGVQQSALTSAAGLVSPTLGGYNQQPFYPSTGQFGAGQGGTNALSQLPPQAQTAVNSYAEQVRNGSMTRQDAESRLSAYGVGGTNALNEVLGQGFNTNASNASAGTTAVGQQIQAALPPANQALDALQTAFSNLPGIQSTSIPYINGFMQNLAMNSGIGRDQASAFQGALNEARSRIDAALVGAIGVNAAAAQSHALLPDNMIPSEIPQKIAAAKQYLQNQVTSYTQSGQQGANTGGSSLYSF